MNKGTLMNDTHISLAHGGGGELTRLLLSERVIPKLSNPLLDPLGDSAVLPQPDGRVCMTTDAFVVQPLEFPGGDIGRLAVCGTVNDLAMAGARPTALSLAIVVEEGLEMSVFDRMIDSIAAAADEAGVPIATGDTKVIERGRGDGMIITTAGIGTLRDGVNLDAGRIVPGDVVIVTGLIAEHGLAVMSARKGLAFETELLSDVAPLVDLAGDVFSCGADVKFMRDPTRGGVSGVLVDLAEQTKLSLDIDERALPISAVAQSTADMLGLDPMTVANEGKAVIVVAEAEAEAALRACRANPLGTKAAIVGKFTEATPPLVELITRPGGRRMVTRPYGEELPRIC